jgi:xanthine dehydrogenase YagS FAD-binding subunit
VRNATYEVRQKQALDWPLATASVALAMKGDTVTTARIVLGHVAPVPWLATKANDLMTGKKLTPEVMDQAASAALDGATPLSQNAYKIALAKTAVKRALSASAGSS